MVNGVGWIMPWHRHSPDAIGHDDVLALPQNARTSFLQRSNSHEMIDAGQLRHG